MGKEVIMTLQISISTDQDRNATVEALRVALLLVERLEQKFCPLLVVVFNDVEIHMPPKHSGDQKMQFHYPKVVITVFARTSFATEILSTHLSCDSGFTEVEAFNELSEQFFHLLGLSFVDNLPIEDKELLRTILELQQTKSEGWVQALDVAEKGVQEVYSRITLLTDREFLMRKDFVPSGTGYRVATWAAPYL